MLRIARSCLTAGACTEGVLAAALPCRNIWSSSTCHQAEPALSDHVSAAPDSSSYPLGAIRTDWTCVHRAYLCNYLSVLSCSSPQRERSRAAARSHSQKRVLCICRREEVTQVYDTPLLELVFNAATVHRMYNDPRMVSPSRSCLCSQSELTSVFRD